MNKKGRTKSLTSYLLIMFCCLLTGCTNDNVPESDKKELLLLKEWKAGEKVSPESIATFGVSGCFQSMEINDALFKRMYKKSFKENCTFPCEDLRYLKALHYNLQGEICLGEMVCNKALSTDLLEIFKALYDARYPIERMVLIDEYDADDERSMTANNSSGFNFRLISGSTTLSNHSKGCAIDINPLYNPYVKATNGVLHVEPAAGKAYVDRTGNFPYKINHDDLCFNEFAKRGFTWGGDWESQKDYQHFEKTVDPGTE